jgi:hypothetical protein
MVLGPVKNLKLWAKNLEGQWPFPSPRGEWEEIRFATLNVGENPGRSMATPRNRAKGRIDRHFSKAKM